MLGRRSTALLLACTLVLPFAAGGQERLPPELSPEPAPAGTVEDARDLREALQAYLTATPFDLGALRVEPDEAGLRIVLDPADLIAEIVGRPVEFSPLSFVVSERPDGDWNVFWNDPIEASATFEIGGEEQSEAYRQDWQAYKGVFSPSLGTFLSLAGESGPTSQVSSDAFSQGLVGFMGSAFEMTAQAAAGGGVDLAFRQTYDGFAQTLAVEIPLDESAPEETFAFSFEASLASVENSGTSAGLRTRELLDLYVLALSHAEALAEDPRAALSGPVGEELKTALETALPLWDELDVTGEAEDFGVTTLFGDFAIERLVQTLRMSGIDESTFFETDVSLSGISTRSVLVPEWAGALTPTLIEFGLTAADIDLSTPLDILLREADFEREDILSPEAADKMIAAFDRERIRLGLDGGRIEAELFDLSFEGSVSIARGGPDARLNLAMSGLDETIAALQAAAVDTPELNEGIGMLQLAKGFSRPGEDGRAIWDIEARPDGSVHLNGAMLKGPDAPGADEGDEGDEGARDEL